MPEYFSVSDEDYLISCLYGMSRILEQEFPEYRDIQEDVLQTVSLLFLSRRRTAGEQDKKNAVDQDTLLRLLLCGEMAKKKKELDWRKEHLGTYSEKARNRENYAEGPEEILQVRYELQELLEPLSLQDRKLVLSKFQTGMDYDMLARAEHCSPAALSCRMYRIRKKLQQDRRKPDRDSIRG